MRIVTGLPSYTKLNYLYFETGIEKLSERRKRRKLQLIYKMHNNLTPTFLSSLLPSTVGDNDHYYFRNHQNYRIPYYRLSLTLSSFLPSSLQYWNNLDNSIKLSTTLNIFKNAMNPNLESRPSYFSFGDRKFNILHTKIRYQCSPLNYDLFRARLIDNPVCNCGHPCENAYHYFFECQQYADMRNILFLYLYPLTVEINLDLLLNGNEHLPGDSNRELFRHVQNFMRSSRRF